MIRKTRRPFSDGERKKLLHLRPSFLFRGRRKVAEQELDEGLAEVLDLEISRAWDLSGCRPPCCPHSYLFQASEKEFVYVESWAAFNYPEGQFPTSKMEIVRSPVTKHILSVCPEGEFLRAEAEPFDPATEYFFSSNVECEVLEESDLSGEVQSMLSAK
jgi:hypothetical protein